MKRLLATLVLTLACLAAIGAAAVPAARADACSAVGDALGCACTTTQNATGTPGTSAPCDSSQSDRPIYGSGSVLQRATLILGIIGGITAVIVIIIAGIMFVTANGNAQQITNARNAIIGAVVGLVVMGAAVSIVTFVVNKT